MAKREPERPARTDQLMEKIVERVNLKAALQRVKANRGSPGGDGVTVQQLPGYLREHWPALRDQLLQGTYQPQPVKRVAIPKPGGGVRKLGIPTVLDRFLQQAVLQVLQCRWDRTFSAHSYGFRPHPSAHQAVAQAQQYIADGYRWVVDLDLEKFFDTIPHDRLLAAVAPRVADRHVLRLLVRWLRAPVVVERPDGKKEVQGGKRTRRGTPQGGVISPLLANVYLHAFDMAWRTAGLERRWQARLIRYADDCAPRRRGKEAGMAP